MIHSTITSNSLNLFINIVSATKGLEYLVSISLNFLAGLIILVLQNPYRILH